ncbi:MAG: CRISPR-associated helicase Cas3' [Candidatus Hodarchaeales archaeon]
MFEESAEKIFDFFNKEKNFTQLATKEGSCEHTELSYHINRMMRVYTENKKELSPSRLTKRCQELYDVMVKVAIIFHDMGKLNCFFQYRMVGIRNRKKRISIQKKWSYHSGLSSFIVFLFLNYIEKKLFKEITKDVDCEFLRLNFKVIVINAIICHHSALYPVDKREAFEDFDVNEDYHLNNVFYFYKYLSETVESLILGLDKNIVNEGLRGNIQENEFLRLDIYVEVKNFFQLLTKTITNYEGQREQILEGIKNQIESYNECVRYELTGGLKDQIIFLLIVHLSSLLTNIDKWEAKTTRAQIEYIRKIEFKRPSDKTCIERPFKYLEEYLQTNKRQSPLNPIRGKFSRLVSQKKKQAELKRVYTITAPCGIGKTLAALDFAFGIREKFYQERGYFPKIIYALPFISICDQIENVLKSIFKKESQTDFLTVHHTLAGFTKDYQPDEEEFLPLDDSYLNSYELRNWYSEIIVTTTIKLFNTLLTYQKWNLVRFHRITNSIIIIDEYHSIPKRYHELIRNFLIALTQMFNITFILMTATTPGLFKQKDDILELTAIDDQNKLTHMFNGINRYKIRFHYKKYELEKFKEFCKYILKSNHGKSIMIVLNTRNLVKELYNYFSNLNKSETAKRKREIIHLSSNMFPFHRKKILKRINTILKEKKENKNLVLVTTQLIEAGVDVSFQKIIRDLGPFYSIVQVAGRCNRNWEVNKPEKIPIIEVINVNNSHKRVYDNIEIETTVEYFDSHKRQKNDEFIELSEVKIREEFNRYSEKLNVRKIREKCLDEYKGLDFGSLSQHFKLIQEIPRIPIIVVPEDGFFENNEYKNYLREARNLIDKIRLKEIKYFPLKLYGFVVEVYENKREEIERISIDTKEIREDTPQAVFERFELKDFEFYVLDLKNEKAKKLYNEKLGLILPP